VDVWTRAILYSDLSVPLSWSQLARRNRITRAAAGGPVMDPGDDQALVMACKQTARDNADFLDWRGCKVGSGLYRGRVVRWGDSRHRRGGFRTPGSGRPPTSNRGCTMAKNLYIETEFRETAWHILGQRNIEEQTGLHPDPPSAVHISSLPRPDSEHRHGHTRDRVHREQCPHAGLIDWEAIDRE